MPTVFRTCLFLFGLAAISTGGPVCNVIDFGAKNDGSVRATAAIRRAIEACKGGGTVLVPAGTYVTGAIELTSNIELRLDAGATLRFHADLSEYPLVKGRFEGIEAITPAPLIGGMNVENIAITGRGTITTDNAEWRKLMNVPEARAMWRSILERVGKKETVPEVDYRTAARSLRPSVIRPMNATNVLIDGIRIRGASMWGIHLLYCDKAVVRNVTVETYDDANGDGIDVDSSSNVRISDCYLDTGDDGICLKSGKDADGRRVGRPTENVTITNCVIHRAHGAVVLGSETSGGIRNVVASNIVSRGTDRGIRIKSTRGRGAVLENIRFDNWVIEDPVRDAIMVTNYYTPAPPEPVSERTPVFRNIAISNVTISRAPVAVNIEGLPEMPVENLRVQDVIGTAKAGLRAFNTKGLELRNVRIEAAEGPAFLIRDSAGAELDGLETRQPTAAPAIRLDNCEDVVVRNGRAWSASGTYLSAQPGTLKKVTQIGNASGKAEEAEADYWKDIRSPDRPRTK